ISINFEDYKHNDLKDPDNLYTYISRQIKNKKKYYIFLDEVQNVKNFELVINSFRATENVSIFVTGSTSKLLSGELATHLGGRTLQFRIMPFCFSEFYQFTGSADAETALTEYLEWGGLPLVCKASTASDKAVIIENIYDSIVLKDIVQRNKIASTAALEKVIEYILANSSTTISGNAVANTLTDQHLKISSPTVYDYVKYITDACICDKVARYDIRGKKLLAFEEKVYAADLGLIGFKKNRVKDEYGYIIETLCYNELISRGYKVYVGKMQNSEVDFIAEKQDEKFYLQACYFLSSEKTIEREFGAYDSISDNFPKYIVSMDKLTIKRDGIIHKNLIDFLLE
ncbi:MAG: ATP-binding protein, partial [Anaerovoracaceae bacterium]